ncbi:MAG: hypothetical protein J0M12_15495 [Deltaproteobacteria bacterium]|nr:hypothetical protein [Deltaproteobacteria bacterium]
MNTLLPDKIARKHQGDLSALFSRRSSSLLKFVVLFAAFSLVIIAALSAIPGYRIRGDTLEKARLDLARSGLIADHDFFSRHEYFREWLRLRGTQSERELYDTVSQIIFRSASDLAPYRGSPEGMTFFKSSYLSLHLAVLRIAFIVIASWRLWLFAILLAVMLEYYSLKVFSGDDLLGQTGNGRLFFSGARLQLEPMNSSGAPEKLVRGLACPPLAQLSAVKSSKLGNLLERFGVANETNLMLAAVIVEHKDLPAYVATSDETELLSNYYVGAKLLENATLIVEKALSLHQSYRAMQMSNERLDAVQAARLPETEETVQRKVSATEYADLLHGAMHRVLTPDMRTNLSELRPTELATIILAYEAGKVLAFAREGPNWVRKSNFGNLSARAVVHSIAAFAKEYSYDERSVIRRALIYAARSSPFAPVRFPIDLNDKARSARQWTELLMACPHELQAVADEVELVGIIAEAQRSWAQLFLDGAMALDPEVVDDVYATPTNLFFMPAQKVLGLMRKVIEHSTLRRLEELVARVSQKQRLELMSLDFAGDNAEKGLSNPERIFTPLAHRELKTLAAQHNMTTGDIRDWSTLRVVLNSYGWLGRRLGDYTVPESSIVSVVFRVDPSMPGANEYARLGKQGMVAFRGTRLEAKWGKFWQTRFISVQGVTMAESQDDYDQLMKGIEKQFEEEEAMAPAVGGS